VKSGKSLGTKSNHKGKSLKKQLKKRKRSDCSDEDSSYEDDSHSVKEISASNETSIQSSSKNSNVRNGLTRGSKRVEKLREKKQIVSSSS
jgi:hypothetical protein